MNQQVIITLRGSAELKEMLVTLSKLKHEPMNAVVTNLVRKEYTYQSNRTISPDAEIDPRYARTC